MYNTTAVAFDRMDCLQLVLVTQTELRNQNQLWQYIVEEEDPCVDSRFGDGEGRSEIFRVKAVVVVVYGER